MRSTGIFTASAQNPSGNGVLLAGQSGLQYVQLNSLNPLQITHDPLSSIEFNAPTSKDDLQTTITALCWRPDSACINVAFSNGQIDEISPSLSAFQYCGADVNNVAPNKAQLRLKGFQSKNNQFAEGILELTCSQSSEIQRIRSNSKAVFTQCQKSGHWAKNLYVYAIGDRSICVYSFDTDIAVEIPIQLQQNDKLFFDVGVKHVIVQANMQMGEFTVVKLPQNSQQQLIVYSTIR